MDAPITPSDLSVGFTIEGRYVGWNPDADAVVFTPDGNHIATLQPATGGGWTPTEIPGFPDHPDMGRTLDTESDIREWAAKL